MRRNRSPFHESGRRLGARVLLAATLAGAAGGCTQIDTAIANVPFFASMKNSPSFDPYEMTREAPPHSVPYASPNGEYEPHFGSTVPGLDSLAAYVTPPASFTAAEVARGAALYHRNCMVCHGPEGHGDGPIVGPKKFAFPPPNLTLPLTVGRSDGYIYGIIRQGRGLMPPYGERITPDDRWYVVAYVRQLQQAAAQGTTPPAGVYPPKAGDNGWAPPARGMVGMPENAMKTYGAAGAAPGGAAGAATGGTTGAAGPAAGAATAPSGGADTSGSAPTAAPDTTHGAGRI